jgi:hypothetical protein
LLRTCPFCKADIPAEARKCKYCREWVNFSDDRSAQPTEPVRIQVVRTPLTGLQKVGIGCILALLISGGIALLGGIIYTLVTRMR